MRDPSIYRVITSPPHYRTATRYKVYPIYDFACPIVDSVEGVTHALRSNEYHDRDEQYDYILKATGVRPVRIKSFSRLNFNFTLMSKRKLTKFIDKGLVEGWDSPSFPTIRGVMRRGLTLDALKTFIYSQGSSVRDTLQSMDKLWAINRVIIDRQVKRYTAISEKDAVKVKLLNGPKETEYRSALWCKPNPDLGEKVKIYTSEIWIEQGDAAQLTHNEEFTLMDWGNVIVKSIVKDGEIIKEIHAELHLEGDFKTTKWKLTWIPNVEDLVPVEVYKYGPIITKDKLEENDNLDDFVNPNISSIIKFLGDPALRLLPAGERIQLERRGYFICDRAYLGFDGKPLKLILIPDGKQTEMATHLTL